MTRIGLAFWLILTIPGGVALAQVDGVVRDMGSMQPIEGAIVTLQTSDTRVVTDANGNFSMPGVTGIDLVIVAAQKGYFHNFEFVSSPDPAVEILLEAVPQDDNPDYFFSSPLSCGFCHNDHFDTWENSPMNLTGLNSWLYDIYNGTGTAGGMGGFVYVDDSVHAAVNPKSECASCHQPEAWITTPGTGLGDIEIPTAAMLHGVSCDVCHKVADVNEAQLNSPGFYLDHVTVTRPFGPQDVMYGILGDAAFYDFVMRPSLQPQLDSVVCAVCHEDNNDPDQDGDFEEPGSLPHQETYSEWKESIYGDPQSPSYTACTTCHFLPFSQGDGQVCIMEFPPPYPLVRPASQKRSHNVRGTSTEFLQNAVTLSVDREVIGDTLFVDVDILNDKTGHSVPSGSSTRNMILFVEAFDENLDPIPYTGVQTIDELGGIGDAALGYYSGLPGKLYAKINVDGSGLQGKGHRHGWVEKKQG